MKPKIDVIGTKFWMLNDKCHREDGPAVEKIDGFKSWWIHGKRHRTDGPAIVCRDGEKEWWIKGIELTEQEWLSEVLFNEVKISSL